MNRFTMMVLAASTVLLADQPGQAADRTMTTADFTALFSSVKVIKLGGPSSDYYGALILTGTATEGTARGLVLASGSWKGFKGPWKVQSDRFCRTWDTIDAGKRICEIWKLHSDSAVTVFVGSTEIGVNSW